MSPWCWKMCKNHQIEKELKKELNRIDKKLKRTQSLQLMAWMGSAVGLGLALSTVASHVPILLGMAAGGALLSAAARHFVSRKKP